MPEFGERLALAFESSGHLCVGIDPHPYLLSEWGLPDSGEGLREFGLRVVAASAGRVGIVKPQVAFFERHGSAGFAALEAVLAEARAAGLLVIADAKRGDVGSSVEAYGQAWLTPGSPLEADAMTMNPFQGVASLAAPFTLARQSGKGIFLLAATSNPEGRELQQSRHNDRTVAAGIVEDVMQHNVAATALGSVGVVIGATVSASDFGIELDNLARTPVLAPGFGHQGAKISDLRGLFGAASDNVLVSASRSILDAGPDGLVAAIDEQRLELAEVFAL